MYGYLDVVKILAHHDPQTIEMEDKYGDTAHDKAISDTHVSEFLKEIHEGQH